MPKRVLLHRSDAGKFLLEQSMLEMWGCGTGDE